MQLTFSKHDQKKEKMMAKVLLSLALGLSSWGVFITSFALIYSAGNALSGGLRGGLICCWNSCADYLGSLDYILLPRFATDETEYGLFLTFALIVSIFIAFFVVRSRIRHLIWVYLVPFIFGTVFFGLCPDVLWTVAMVIVLAVFCFFCQKEGHSIFAAMVPLMLVCAVTTVISFSLMYTVGLGGWSGISKIHDTFIAGVDNSRYGQTTLKNGDLEKIGSRKTEKAVALTVKMENPEPMYLRGFIGENYNSGSWEHLSNNEYYKLRDKLYWLHKSGFSGLSQLQTAASKTEKELKTQQIKVTNEGTDRRNVYTPYEIISTEKLKETAGDSYLCPQGIFGTGEYTFTVSEPLTNRWTTYGAKLFSEQETEKSKAYFRLESKYNVFVYDEYTDLSDEAKATMGQILGKTLATSKNHADYKPAINRIRQYLEDNFIYSQQPLQTEEGQDILDTFVKAGRGCDAHFATAATLMFRYYGIPARYVEGYLITPKDAENADRGETMKIPEENIHAWTEIYVDGLGWVPIEVTPEYYGVMPEADMSVGLESVARQAESNPKDSTTKVRTKESEEGKNNGIRTTILIGGIFLLLVLIFIALHKKIRRAAVLAKERLDRRQAYKSGDIRRGICAAYGYILKRDISVDEETHRLGNKAAYSKETMDDKDLQYVLYQLKRGKHEKRKEKKQDYIHRIGRPFISLLQLRHGKTCK